jgi:hypothetical protein
MLMQKMYGYQIFLLFYNKKINLHNKNYLIKGLWQTPLHIAAEAGDENLVKFFYLCKANPNIADKEGVQGQFLC